MAAGTPHRQPSSNGPAPHRATVVVPNDPAAIDRAQNDLMAAVEQHGYTKASVFAIRLSLHEAMSNAFRHGHAGLPPTVPVTLTYTVTEQTVEISIQDQGPGFRPQDIPDPTLDENLERGSGRGLLLINAYMAEAEYSKNGTHLRMLYRRPA